MNKLIAAGFQQGFLEKAAGISEWWSGLQEPARGMLIGAPIGAGVGGLGGYFIGPKEKKLMSTLVGGLGGGALGAGIGSRIGESILEKRLKAEEAQRQQAKEELFETGVKAIQEEAEEKQKIQEKLFEPEAPIEQAKKTKPEIYEKGKSLSLSAAKDIDEQLLQYEKLMDRARKTKSLDIKDVNKIIKGLERLKYKYKKEVGDTGADISDIISEIDEKIRDIKTMTSGEL